MCGLGVSSCDLYSPLTRKLGEVGPRKQLACCSQFCLHVAWLDCRCPCPVACWIDLSRTLLESVLPSQMVAFIFTGLAYFLFLFA